MRLIGRSGLDVRCLSYSAGDQSMDNVTMETLTMDVDAFDTAGIHDTVTNNTRHTVPAGHAGIWECRVRAHGAAFAAAQAGIALFVNGTSGTRIAHDFRAGTTGVNNTVECTAIVSMAVGDYFEAAIYQNSGSAQTYLGWTNAPNMGTSMFSRRIA